MNIGKLNRKTLCKSLVTLIVFPLTFTCQDAMAVSFNFRQDYVSLESFLPSSSTLRGEFSGEDANNDGILECDLSTPKCEISNFQAIFKGSILNEFVPNAPATEFYSAWKFPELVDFQFTFNLATNNLSLAAIAENRILGGSDLLFLEPFGGGIDLATFGDFGSSNSLVVTKIPEPSTSIGSLLFCTLLLCLKRYGKNKVRAK